MVSMGVKESAVPEVGLELLGFTPDVMPRPNPVSFSAEPLFVEIPLASVTWKD